MLTTRKEASRVVVKREVVRRERGWRWGGILREGDAEERRGGLLGWALLAAFWGLTWDGGSYG